MSISTLTPPSLSVPETKDQITTTVSEIHSMEESYGSICNQALETIDAFLGYPELDAGIREHLRILLPKIYSQKNKILELMSQAQDTLDVDGDNTTTTPTRATEDPVNDDDMNIDPEAIAEYEQKVNDFTAMAQELNQHLEVLAKVVAPKN